MKTTTIALSLLAGMVAACATDPHAPLASASALPNCFDSNYDAPRGLFTINGAAGDPANQQCLLTVVSRYDTATSPRRLLAGNYAVSVVNGGGGGAGGTVQPIFGGGGGGGGGAGAAEHGSTINLQEGVYKLTIGAGGPGGSACIRGAHTFSGGPGWLGSPSNIVRVPTGEVIAGSPGADRYVRPTRSENERLAGSVRDGRGGSGPGQASGGHAGYTDSAGTKVEATGGAGKLATGPASGAGGTPGVIPRDDQRSGSGGGGGASSKGTGGSGGGESAGNKDIQPARGSLGSGGGGGVGNSSGCEPGARGGNGFIALRPL